MNEIIDEYSPLEGKPKIFKPKNIVFSDGDICFKGRTIRSLDAENINSFYDPRKEIDGGGYWQPQVVATFDNGITFNVIKYNQGAFGSFYILKIYNVDEPEYFKEIYMRPDSLTEIAEDDSIKINWGWNESLDGKDVAELLRFMFYIGNPIARAELK